ncbi:sulfur relay protein DsrC [Thiohalobacter sp. IOR34]|uniref:sulfur relay protein DsrC n=1 Tax=Thiohalobacter sp. IOR34 TaxID=3057176 RepID=UPI0025B0598D|nr:sulfur relay protein DsrC [Thiohalobacter sp. IOR34]WJW74340.1 sulfur relay protein DsrC [Thiohalobacter sp. IOR34]
MLWLSEVLLQEHDLASFEDLCRKVQERAAQGELFFQMDVKPPFPDTPADWEDRLEAAFAQAPKR